MDYYKESEYLKCKSLLFRCFQYSDPHCNRIVNLILVIVYFFQNGARGIHTAAMKGHVAVINTMLSKGENVDAVTNVSHFNWLHYKSNLT